MYRCGAGPCARRCSSGIISGPGERMENEERARVSGSEEGGKRSQDCGWAFLRRGGVGKGERGAGEEERGCQIVKRDCSGRRVTSPSTVPCAQVAHTERTTRPRCRAWEIGLDLPRSSFATVDRPKPTAGSLRAGCYWDRIWRVGKATPDRGTRRMAGRRVRCAVSKRARQENNTAEQQRLGGLKRADKQYIPEREGLSYISNSLNSSRHLCCCALLACAFPPFFSFERPETNNSYAAAPPHASSDRSNIINPI